MTCSEKRPPLQPSPCGDTEISFNKRFDGNYFSKYVFIKTFRLRHWGIMRSWRVCPMQCWRRIWWVTWLIWIWDVSARCCALSRPQSWCNATARSKMEIKTKRYEAETFLSQQHHLLCRRTSSSAALNVNSHHWPFFVIIHGLIKTLMVLHS